MENIQTQATVLSYEHIMNLFLETREQFKETDRRMQETDKQIKELGKQIGGLGNKFGSYNEGLFMPSLNKMLEKRFKCKSTTENFYFKDNGHSFEIDLLGVTEESCYVVEIKSHLKDEHIEQTIKKIELLNKYSAMFKTFKKYGIIVATKHTEESVKRVINNGLYFISTSDDLAKLKIPKGFKPNVW
jgi:hypothetical protein